LSKGVQDYRCCITYLFDEVYLSTGTSGTDITYDGGKNWEELDSIGFNSIKFSNDSSGMAVGSYGKIAKIKLQ